MKIGTVMGKPHFLSQRMDWKTPKAVYQTLDAEFRFDHDPCPAYTAGYLLRKLPKLLDIDGASFSLCVHTNVAPPDWTAYYMFVQVVDGKLKRYSNRLKVEADTPEDALCKLAIELFKRGILTEVEA